MKEENVIPETKRFLLVTHTFATGPSQELRDYFVNKQFDFAFLEHPLIYTPLMVRSKITFFFKGKVKKITEGVDSKHIFFLHFISDFFYTLYFIINAKQEYDVCVAVDNLNFLASFILKKLGFCKKLIYWTIDYTPKRFENVILNTIYHGVDRFCCYNSDVVWNSSKRMKEARRHNGVNTAKCAPEIIVPDGSHFKEIERMPSWKADRFKLVFMGHLIKKKGVDLVISSLPELLRDYPQLTLTIIGTGDEENALKELARKLNVADKVFFMGYIEDHKNVERIIANCGIGLAPYVPDPNSFTFFSDVGKVKIYLACGLPVLITNVPEIASDLQKEKAGIVFEYNKQSFVINLKELLDNEKKYLYYRNNAVRFIENLSWDRIFDEALAKSRDL